MRISVLMPSFNRAALLPHAVRSVLEQTRPAFEILVVDDGSTDGTPDIIAGLAAPNLRYVRQENAGKATAMNRGLGLVRGDAVLVLDDDDLLPCDALQRHAQALGAAPHAGFSYGGFVRFEGDGPAAEPAPGEVELVPHADRRRLVVKLMENCFLPNPCWLVRRQAWEAAGPYRADLRRSQDYDMILRLARADEGVAVPGGPVLYQRKHLDALGPQAERARERHSVSGWVRYDRLLFEELDDHWSLADFRPFSGNFGPAEEAAAWLQRAVVLFLRKAYPRSITAFARFGELLAARPAARPTPAELAIAGGLLGCRYGLDELRLGEEGDIVARGLRRPGFPLALRVALGTQLRWRVRNAVREGDASQALQLMRFGIRAFGTAAVSRILLGGRAMNRLVRTQLRLAGPAEVRAAQPGGGQPG